MRKVSYLMMVSLDGFIETPDKGIDWILIDEEIHRFANEQAQAASAFLYGRRMYEVMAGYWPTADANPSAPQYEVEFARIWREKPKVVFSTTLKQVAWNSRLVSDNIAAEVTRLKEQPAGDMEVSGANLAASFLRLGLIDEVRLLVNPIVLGGGTPFFPALDHAINLRLVETRRFASGVVYLRYERTD